MNTPGWLEEWAVQGGAGAWDVGYWYDETSSETETI